jgi:hypothetical protein
MGRLARLSRGWIDNQDQSEEAREVESHWHLRFAERRRASRMDDRLRGVDPGFVDEHVRDAVFHSVDAVTLPALQALRILPVIERLLADRADQNLEQVFVEHADILKEILIDDF